MSQHLSKKSTSGVIKTEKVVPFLEYNITSDNLFSVLDKYVDLKSSHISRILTDLSKFEVKTQERYTENKKDMLQHKKNIPPRFKMKKTIEFFFVPSLKRYIPISLIIKKSTIPGAGFGVFAGSDIPFRAKGEYEGVLKSENNANMYYSWEIKEYNKKTGNPDYEGEVLYYRDASDIKKSNWSRFVNCHAKEKRNNLVMHQKYNKIYYQTSRRIKKGEELFVFYGEDYVKYNLKVKD